MIPSGPRREKPAFSIPAIGAVVAAVLSFTSGAAMGFIMAIAAIALGVFGLILALSPQVRGGVVSIVSIVAGAIGIIAAVFKLVL